MNDISKAFKENEFTSELLNALPCGILVITEDGTVVRLNSTIEHIFGVKNAEVVGEGFGRALCCVNTCDDRKEYGSDDGCGECEIRKLALMALYSNEKKRGRVSLQVNIDRHIKDVTFLVCAAPFKFKRDRLSILTIRCCILLLPFTVGRDFPRKTLLKLLT